MAPLNVHRAAAATGHVSASWVEAMPYGGGRQAHPRLSWPSTSVVACPSQPPWKVAAPAGQLQLDLYLLTGIIYEAEGQLVQSPRKEL